MTKNKKNSGGFTLVEVTLTTFLLIVAFMGLAAMTATVVNGNAFSKMSTTASAVAAAKMEDLKSIPFSDAGLTAGTHTDAGNPIQGLYTRTWNVTDFTDASGANVTHKVIDLTVTWNGQNKSRSMSLRTLRTR